MDNYGKELILDIHKCDTTIFTRNSIKAYCEKLCELIDMEPCEFHFWDDLDTPEEDRQTSLHTTGISAVQFILTSNITVHTLELLGCVYINIFSCRDFNSHIAKVFTENWFQGEIVKSEIIDRI